MPHLERPDGALIHWEEDGRGPTVVLTPVFWAPARGAFRDRPGGLRTLIDDVARDHRVITYDVRGTGESSRDGPFDSQVDATDLEALLEEVGGGALVVSAGDGFGRAVRVGVARPDLAPTVAVVGLVSLPAGLLERTSGADALVGSRRAMAALLAMCETDHRAALRQMVELAWTTSDEDERRRVVDEAAEYCSREVLLARMRAWLADDSLAPADGMRERLMILHHGRNPFFPAELLELTRSLLPQARFEELADGWVSRPDLTAAAIRELTATPTSVPRG